MEVSTSKGFKYDHNEIPLENNQMVILKDFYLTEWTPKLSGRIWTSDGNINLIEGIEDVVGQVNIYNKIIDVLGPQGKSKLVTGGFGSVRIKPKINSDYCMLLNAVSAKDWHCVSSQVKPADFRHKPYSFCR